MKVITAQKRGFCFGVEHAIEIAQKLLDAGNNVYCLGPLIHNRHVVQRFSAAGLKVVDSVHEIDIRQAQRRDATPPTVLIRSHGCRPERLQEIEQRGYNLVDATCILVKRAQKLVRELYDEGYKVIVVGDPNHPEVRGVVGYAPEVYVVDSPDDLGKLPKSGRVAVISQTTASLDDFSQIVGHIARRGYGELKVVNTICSETARRQASAVELCKQVDVMFVLGSHHSANTGELAQLCRRQGVDTYHLENFQEFDPEYVTGHSVAGVTAGASTPDWIIQEFVNNLQKFNCPPSEHTTHD